MHESEETQEEFVNFYQDEQAINALTGQVRQLLYHIDDIYATYKTVSVPNFEGETSNILQWQEGYLGPSYMEETVTYNFKQQLELLLYNRITAISAIKTAG